MSKLSKKIKTMFTTKCIIEKKIVNSSLIKLFSDRRALKIIYKSIFERKLDLKNPKTFNEKLQWLKLYNRRPEYTTMVDKYAVKKYVADIIGEEYIIPTLGVWDRFEDIDFNTLPEKFVLKTTHGSGDIVVCKDKNNFDIETARKKLTKSLEKDYYKIAREWPYKNVPRKIIAEQYMEDVVLEYTTTPKDIGLTDYKVFCFNGQAKMILVAIDRFAPSGVKFNYYDRDFNLLDFDWTHERTETKIDKPPMLDKMFELAEKLSKGIPHLRVDFYQVGSKIYFGELTFFHAGGFTLFNPNEWDEKIGSWLTLPEKYKRG